MSSLNPIGLPFIELPAVDSTNNYAMGLVREGMAQHGTAVFAHEQTRGKGQRNKQWLSGNRDNIALSLILNPGRILNTEVFILSMAAANAAFQLINRYIPEELSIKWPNDIYWRVRKAAGILIENIWQRNKWKHSIVGTGINVNQQDFGTLGSRAVSIKQITGKEYVPVALARELCEIFDEQFRLLLSDPEKVVECYRKNLYKKDEKVKLKKGSRVFEAVIKDVTTGGQLIVQHAVEEGFDVGEVEWLVNYG